MEEEEEERRGRMSSSRFADGWTVYTGPHVNSRPPASAPSYTTTSNQSTFAAPGPPAPTVWPGYGPGDPRPTATVPSYASTSNQPPGSVTARSAHVLLGYDSGNPRATASVPSYALNSNLSSFAAPAPVGVWPGNGPGNSRPTTTAPSYASFDFHEPYFGCLALVAPFAPLGDFFRNNAPAATVPSYASASTQNPFAAPAGPAPLRLATGLQNSTASRDDWQVQFPSSDAADGTRVLSFGNSSNVCPFPEASSQHVYNQSPSPPEDILGNSPTGMSATRPPGCRPVASASSFATPRNPPKTHQAAIVLYSSPDGSALQDSVLNTPTKIASHPPWEHFHGRPFPRAPAAALNSVGYHLSPPAAPKPRRAIPMLPPARSGRRPTASMIPRRRAPTAQMLPPRLPPRRASIAPMLPQRRSPRRAPTAQMLPPSLPPRRASVAQMLPPSRTQRRAPMLPQNASSPRPPASMLPQPTPGPRHHTPILPPPATMPPPAVPNPLPATTMPPLPAIISPPVVLNPLPPMQLDQPITSFSSQSLPVPTQIEPTTPRRSSI
ncbi:hypothetical protein E2P81_ATG02986 [Venturia nashicola]|uniref:Uncharacterized protein n=1 Tax=Venturia nashicola TaxID=86259 RepID=A0A4Z1P5N3_9PEZI|nr:hypothetical protein E6O75_ATG03051 [Venturia nashicola]TLD36097.1 hypothetical protein E2P81_ATG02986 [Venturia nashicola]